jgi:hypothetical protein
MTDYPVLPDTWHTPISGWLLRFAASGLVPARWFRPPMPPIDQRQPFVGHLQLEVVSHCWRYAHLLVYQLSSLVQFPPSRATVTMTVYFCPEDADTAALLDWFGALQVPGVIWNWQPRPKQALFRRAIGRNEAALASRADWIWFTDCDLMFRRDCIDTLATLLQGRRDALVFPRMERCTAVLPDQDPLLNPQLEAKRLAEVDDASFVALRRTRATGPLQITHGDVARSQGYCRDLAYYQRPSATWCKAHEDRAFRWLLGTRGIPLDIPGVYRIRHETKGRYTRGAFNTRLRSAIRRLARAFKERGSRPDQAG